MALDSKLVQERDLVWSMFRDMELQIIAGKGMCYSRHIPKEKQLATLRARRDERLREIQNEAAHRVGQVAH